MKSVKEEREQQLNKLERNRKELKRRLKIARAEGDEDKIQKYEETKARVEAEIDRIENLPDDVNRGKLKYKYVNTLNLPS